MFTKLDNFLVRVEDLGVWDYVVEAAKLVTLIWGVCLWISIFYLLR